MSIGRLVDPLDTIWLKFAEELINSMFLAKPLPFRLSVHSVFGDAYIGDMYTFVRAEPTDTAVGIRTLSNGGVYRAKPSFVE